MKIINIGVLAHVDAGKTSLSEALLYTAGSIRKFGRVDHGNSFFDTFAMERERGITIFSKQARIVLPKAQINLLDTPGHVDFSAEMERVLSVLDYAVLVISAVEGVQSHTRTVWRLLKEYEIPCFIFVNKMDYEHAERETVYREIREKLDERIVDFSGGEAGSGGFSKPRTEQGKEEERLEGSSEFLEELSYCDETMMEEYIECTAIKKSSLTEAIAKRGIFPCIFGSALRLRGVEDLIFLLCEYTKMPDYQDEFGAIVYKISHDEAGKRLSHMKITGGRLYNRMQVKEEKINQIRLYNGEKYETCGELEAGNICAVSGLSGLRASEVLGAQQELRSKQIEPVLSYEIRIPKEADLPFFYQKMQEIADEEPELSLFAEARDSVCKIRLFGLIQTEILKNLIRERTGIEVEFSEGSVVYKESIENTVEGVGHYEPLRHYAEVHLLLEPAPRGSGLLFQNLISEERLALGWQNNILSYLKERTHIGVLAGFPITDMRISLVCGKADHRHTDGGDFREAARRALRQGLMQAKNVLLEPYYDFVLSLPRENLGRAMSELLQMSAKFEAPSIKDEEAVLEGYAPVAKIQNYGKDLVAYTCGRGEISFSLRGYELCHNAEEIIDEAGYDPERDGENPSGSVFCAKGSGFYIPWDEVFSHMHLESYLAAREREAKKENREENLRLHDPPERKPAGGISYHQDRTESESLLEIFERTYGKIKPRIGEEVYAPRRIEAAEKPYVYREAKPSREYVLVDGYNVIFAWAELRDLAKINIDSAREKLADILCNYRGYIQSDIILVFDAYKVEGHHTEVTEYGEIYIVYTKQAETADQYIEKTVHEIAKKYDVRVITSDATEQVIIQSKGSRLMSSREFREEIERIDEEIRREYLDHQESKKSYMFDGLSKELREKLERMRLGK